MEGWEEQKVGEKDEHRPSEIEKKKAFHGVKTLNVSPSRRLLRAGGQHRMINRNTNLEQRMVIEEKDGEAKV